MKKITVIMGGPGSGKGSVAHGLCEKENFTCIETGALLRSLPEDSRAAKLIASGSLVPDSELFGLVEEKINESNNVLLDGFPRTLPQAKWLIEKYSNEFSIRIVYLDIPEEVMKQRIKNRFEHGSDRADDNNNSVILHRLDTFQEITMPAISWLREKDEIKFFYIDGTPDINGVMGQVIKVLF
ncbi:MAG: nucleoside monophosphate kinase [Alphaproteobacteria bacterium]|nr:nucleoside monophosphate kinase [Alphaproteobacteria bacterium]